MPSSKMMYGRDPVVQPLHPDRNLAHVGIWRHVFHAAKSAQSGSRDDKGEGCPARCIAERHFMHGHPRKTLAERGRELARASTWRFSRRSPGAPPSQTALTDFQLLRFVRSWSAARPSPNLYHSVPCVDAAIDTDGPIDRTSVRALEALVRLQDIVYNFSEFLRDRVPISKRGHGDA